MKTLVLTALLLCARIAGAQTSSAPLSTNAPLVKRIPFPEQFTNSSGTIYRNIRFQQPYPEGVAISYMRPDRVREMEIIKWKELSPELKAGFGYDPKKEAAYEEKERGRRNSPSAPNRTKSAEQLWDEYDFAVEQRQRERWVDRQALIAQAEKAEREKAAKEQAEAEAKKREQTRQDIYEASWRASQKSAEDNQRARDLWYEKHPDERPLTVGDLPYAERYKHYP